MTARAHLSLIQFTQQPGGVMGLKNLPNITLEAIQDQGTVTGRDWPSELSLPTYYEDWELLSRIRGVSPRHVRFVLMDESPTRLPGNPRLQPQKVTLPMPQTCALELGHTGFLIGVVYAYIVGFDELRTEVPSMLGIELPMELDGDYIIGQAQLFDSPLADAAWLGLQRNIFTHVCPNIFRPTGAEPGTGTLVQVTLTPGDYPGCPNARVLNTWVNSQLPLR